MKLVIMEHPAQGGATWSCFLLPDGLSPDAIKAMGHKVVDVPENEASNFVARMTSSLELQHELRGLYYRADVK